MTDEKFVVAKPFNTRFSRFAVGDKVKATDDFTPYSFEALRQSRILVGEDTKAAEKAIEKSEEKTEEEARGKPSR